MTTRTRTQTRTQTRSMQRTAPAKPAQRSRATGQLDLSAYASEISAVTAWFQMPSRLRDGRGRPLPLWRAHLLLVFLGALVVWGLGALLITTGVGQTPVTQAAPLTAPAAAPAAAPNQQHSEQHSVAVSLAAFTSASSAGVSNFPSVTVVRVTPIHTWIKRVKYLHKGGIYSHSYAHRQLTAAAAYRRALAKAYKNYLKAYGKALARRSFASQQRGIVKAWNRYQKARAKAYANYLKHLARIDASVTEKRVYYGYSYGARVNGVYTTIKGSYSVTYIVAYQP